MPDNTQATTAVIAKKKVIFIDDDLGAPKFKNLPETVREGLEDINSPDLSALWAVGTAPLALPVLSDTSVETVLARVQQDDFVGQVLLTDAGRGAVAPPFRESIDAYLDSRRSLANFADAVRKAFPASDYEIEELSERPDDQQMLLHANLLILDLYMDGGDTLSNVKDYLRGLSAKAEQNEIPPILLVSTQSNTLANNHLAIRQAASISSSGLFVLSKSDVTSNPNGHFMLMALWKQLDDRRAAANSMRKLCKSVNEALDETKSKVLTTLWSLDVAALHEIYTTAKIENDNFNEHIVELLGRDLLWHFEEDAFFNQALHGLGETFAPSLDQTADPPKVNFRYPSFVKVNTESLDSLVWHHTCTPMLPKSHIGDFLLATNKTELASFLPFGAIVVPNTFAVDGEVFINVTPQCDLIKRKLFDKSFSLIFVSAKTVEMPPQTAGKDIYHLKGVVIDGKNYDLHIFPSRTIATSPGKLVELAKAADWKVKARLRNDVAKQVQQSVASNITRRDELTTTRGEEFVCKLFIKFKDAKHGVDWFSDSKDVAFIKVNESKEFKVGDQDAFFIAAWAADILGRKIDAAKFATPSFFNALCSELQMGLKNQGSCEGLSYKVASCAQANMANYPGGLQVTATQMQLVVLYPETH
jgi:hypothetical protein